MENYLEYRGNFGVTVFQYFIAYFFGNGCQGKNVTMNGWGKLRDLAAHGFKKLTQQQVMNGFYQLICLHHSALILHLCLKHHGASFEIFIGGSF